MLVFDAPSSVGSNIGVFLFLLCYWLWAWWSHF
jgi:hypothetical protein